MSAPFRVQFDRTSDGPKWILWSRRPRRLIGKFTTPAEAADYARRNWPWWP